MRDASHPKRKAVAIDCEMFGVDSGRDEIVCIVAVDFLTGKLLFRLLVAHIGPGCRVTDWRTNIHGISGKILNDAWHGKGLELLLGG